MFLVVFRNRKRTDIDGAAYGADAQRMEDRARAQPGFLSFKSYTADDGEVIALSEWRSAEAARAWGSEPDHARTQARGRTDYYQDYTLFTCENPRTHRFERPGE
ncbi:antibiotic biosynthesis monooxygenase [Novosphingobium sp.]|uniref:antibiotic biosynthesis monooxygenase family protein n=1 Tax=Novosphingobium sp. TaxID=1874826 RepID=UPI00286CBD3E|nr:antibiotic biosynthesis monooxygenase [Novosphingobium sp.]